MSARFYRMDFEGGLASLDPADDLTPQTGYNTTHAIVTDKSVSGTHSHAATLTAPRYTDNTQTPDYLPHRGYFIHYFDPPFISPITTNFWIWLDINLQLRPPLNDWFSPFTWKVQPTWDRVITLTIGPTGYLQLEHVPHSNEQVFIYQASAGNGGAVFPMKQWVYVETYLDLNPLTGYGKVWQTPQGGVRNLVSHADIRDVTGYLYGFHGGMYSSAATDKATDLTSHAIVYNDDIYIEETLVPAPRPPSNACHDVISITQPNFHHSKGGQ